MTSCYLNDLGVVCALGQGKDQVSEALFRGCREGMRFSDRYSPQGDTLPEGVVVGEVRADLPSVPAELLEFQSRNSQLLMAALQEIQPSLDICLAKYGHHRIGVVIGTSTSGIAQGEAAHRAYHGTGELPEGYSYLQQAVGTPAELVRRYLGTSGPAFTLSTACSSGARALVSARRLLALGVCDAVIAGGADSLCGMTVQGFSALEAVSASHCNPFSANRDGINIGEGAGLFLMTKEPANVAFLGAGSSSDAYHISGPDPTGNGAFRAMQLALQDAGVSADQVDYLNLHGTATRQNDAMESLAVEQLFGSDLACSSSKPMVGHTLGAAGAIEAAFCWLALNRKDGALPPHLWDGIRDDSLPELNFVAQGDSLNRAVKLCLSNSFAFGGNNISVALGRGLGDNYE
ncbi:beta-ketoacyl-[acyl-carrier-protein] synthase family protein [Porticoccus sp. W117]|uniref:beta-ketoacyl-[acyl-carrier-protein] synthase family protein n=1 Tax=Porticoccus sp. W117 TaxID=3054777 RepID=UPI002599BC6B|nr:beta-ketoacyl-[acyl-carrier-protein] synthase family protein [Porticoccus sp. W117]MDM3869846.1 beta-ketoacyl-[acyl-carrier-protein] synthase family protein [Porticoccus sp. W117]